MMLDDPTTRESASSSSLVSFAQERSGEQPARYQASFAMDAKGMKLEMT